MNTSEHPALGPVRILLVEDNPADVEITQEALLGAKMTVELSVAANANEALELLRGVGKHAWAPLPDIILLDINMPGMSGTELLANLKSDPGLKRIPVIMLTSTGDEHEVLTCYELGASCFIGKPVDFRAFRDVIQGIESFWFTLVKLPPQRVRTHGNDK